MKKLIDLVLYLTQAKTWKILSCATSLWINLQLGRLLNFYVIVLQGWTFEKFHNFDYSAFLVKTWQQTALFESEPSFWVSKQMKPHLWLYLVQTVVGKGSQKEKESCKQIPDGNGFVDERLQTGLKREVNNQPCTHKQILHEAERTERSTFICVTWSACLFLIGWNDELSLVQLSPCRWRFDVSPWNCPTRQENQSSRRWTTRKPRSIWWMLMPLLSKEILLLQAKERKKIHCSLCFSVLAREKEMRGKCRKKINQNWRKLSGEELSSICHPRVMALNASFNGILMDYAGRNKCR